MPDPATATPVQPHPTLRVSDHVVRVVRDCTGRGPTRARSSIDGDLVTVLLRDTLTRGERSLVEDGRGQLVLDMRKAFQSTMRAELVRGVEEILGRCVVGFMSDNHLDPDLAVEVFVLAPEERDA